jgi:predicted adenylyl cyclase CyaB
MNAVEIEIKVLLGSAENAKKLIDKLYENDSFTTLIDRSGQLNHYFLITGDFLKVKKQIKSFLDRDKQETFDTIIQHGVKHSLRTRQANEKILLVIKATADETTSANGTARLERETEIPMTLDELDAILLDAGFTYQSKRSRQREEYVYQDYHVCIDKNAGYGYVAEVEKVVEDHSQIDQVKADIRKELDLLGVKELDQLRLERMFAFYNQHWPEYYGTEKTFIIE